MAAEHVRITGIRPAATSIGAQGLHLRWSFRPAAGFPPKGFRLYRRASGWLKPKKAPLVRTVEEGGWAALEFDEPVVHARVEVASAAGEIALEALDGDRVAARTVASAPPARRTLSVTASSFTRARVTGTFGDIAAVSYVTESAACAATGWVRVVDLPLPTTPDEALARLEPSLANRFAVSRAAAAARYTRALPDLLKWLGLLLRPTSPPFVDATAPPHRLRLAAERDDHPLRGADPQALLLLAALDPNIARMLSLYWVDRLASTGDPQPGRAYDYKIEGLWDTATACGLVFEVGREVAPLPRIDPPIGAKQLPGLRWDTGTPIGRVGLRWPRPAAESGPAGAVLPVLYDVTRVTDGRALTADAPVLVPAAAWTSPGLDTFVDTGAPLGSQSYAVTPIDLFGQVGDKVVSDEIAVRDLVAPPTPVRVRARVSQPGYPWLTPDDAALASYAATLEVQFEYGAAQHAQAPDVRRFHLYSRRDSIFERLPVRLDVVSESRDGDGVHVVARLRRPDGQPLSATALRPFASGAMLTNVRAGASIPPADARRQYRIVALTDPTAARLEATVGPVAAGVYDLVSDPHFRPAWLRVQQAGVPLVVPVRPPLVGLIRAVAADVEAAVVSVRAVSAPPAPFASVPAGVEGGRPLLPPESDSVEVDVDIELLEADLFTEGTVAARGQTFPILAATSRGGARARLRLPAGATVAADDTVTLSARPDVRSLLRWLVIDGVPVSSMPPGGEIAFDVTSGARSVAYIARVVSSARGAGSTFAVLARFSSQAAVSALRPGVTRARYYAPYRIACSVSLATAVTADIVLPVAPGTAARSGYVTASAVDGSTDAAGSAGNEGPLSVPVQFSVVSPPPAGAPGRPYPCDLGADSTQGFATPPDRRGRATVCLRWDLGDMSAVSGARFEVARALDAAVGGAHRARWERDPATPVHALMRAGPRIDPAVLSNVRADAARGAYRGALTGASSADLSAFRGGRLIQDGRCYRVQAMTAAQGGFDVLLSAGSAPPVDGPCVVEGPLDYSGVLADVEALRALAAQHADAFGMATGVPIGETRFVDEVPGIGTGRFFYRVRAVDAAGHRSAWSPVSAPFFQVDTTAPAAPGPVQAVVGDRAVTLIWPIPTDMRVARYRIYRADGHDAAHDIAGLQPYREITLADTMPTPLFVVARSVSLPRPHVLALPSGTSDGQIAAMVASRITVQRLVGEPSNLFDPAASRVVQRLQRTPGGVVLVRISALADLRAVESGTAVRVRVGDGELSEDAGRRAWSDTGLVGGRTYVYRIVAVKHVAKAPAGPGQAPGVIKVPSSPAEPLHIVGLDRSPPPSPQITSVAWVDASGQAVAEAVEGVRARVTVLAPPDTASVLLQRQAVGSDVWTSAVIDGQRGWHDWPPGASQTDLSDSAAAPSSDWTYVVTIRTFDGRMSVSQPLTRTRLP